MFVKVRIQMKTYAINTFWKLFESNYFQHKAKNKPKLN